MIESPRVSELALSEVPRNFSELPRVSEPSSSELPRVSEHSLRALPRRLPKIRHAMMIEKTPILMGEVISAGKGALKTRPPITAVFRLHPSHGLDDRLLPQTGSDRRSV